MHLFGRTTSINVQKVLWTIEELGITFERTDLGGTFGGLGTDAYGKMNPNRRVPTLVDGDLTLWESNSIVRYLSTTKAGGKLAGATSQDVARADMWMEWFQNNCYSHFITLFFQTVRLPKSQRDPNKRDRAVLELTKSFEVLNAHLRNQRYVAGDQFSMGDLIVGSSLYRYFTMDFNHADMPELLKYYDRLSQREAYRKTIITSYESLRPNEE